MGKQEDILSEFIEKDGKFHESIIETIYFHGSEPKYKKRIIKRFCALHDCTYDMSSGEIIKNGFNSSKEDSEREIDKSE